MKTQVYKYAKYYEIAFDFVDINKQVNLLERYITKYSDIPVNTVLDIACGPALQLKEFSRKGYKGFGLDLSEEMVSSLRKECRSHKLNIDVVKGDMVRFSLPCRVDFAYILMGSLAYLRDNNEFIQHLNTVGSNLKSGGLYLIENVAMEWFVPDAWKPQTWAMTRDGVTINTTYKVILKDELNQTVEQLIKMEVNDNGKSLTLEDRDTLKMFMPQELRTIVEMQGDFEFIGYFEKNSLKVLSKADSNNLVVLKRK